MMSDHVLPIMLRPNRWLDDQEFKELTRISDYIGYEKQSGPVFRLNVRKALLNGYSFDDLVNLFDELGINISPEELGSIREEYGKFSISITWNSLRGRIVLDIPWETYRLIKDRLRDLNPRFRAKNETSIKYEILPWRLNELVALAGAYSIPLNDRSGILKPKKLPQTINLKDVELRPYQSEALSKWIENKRQGIIVLPTGSGKTLIGIAAITKSQRRTLIITYTKEQMFQWKEQIFRYTDAKPGLVGLYYSEEKRISPITITTYQSGYRNINILSPYFDLLIIDEVHHLPAEKFKYIAIHSLAPYRMGLSATAIREDGKHEELFPLLGGIIYHRSATELASQGYLARYRIVTIKVKLSPKEKKEYNAYRETYRRFAKGRRFQEVLNLALKGVPDARKALSFHKKMHDIIAFSHSKLKKVVEIVDREIKKKNKIIIFTQYVKQAEELGKMLEKYGALVLTGETPTDKRKKVLENFRSSPSGILIVTTVGDEGLDIPDANIGIIVSGTGSKRQFIQRLGRILRPGKNKEAILYEIIVSGTHEEYQAKRRKKTVLDDFGL